MKQIVSSVTAQNVLDVCTCIHMSMYVHSGGSRGAYPVMAPASVLAIEFTPAPLAEEEVIVKD